MDEAKQSTLEIELCRPHPGICSAFVSKHQIFDFCQNGAKVNQAEPETGTYIQAYILEAISDV